MSLRGRVLDVGGGKKAKYYKILGIEANVETVNINLRQEPTYLVAEIDEEYPLKSQIFDEVLCIDTLKHVYDDEKMLHEIIRLCKLEGRSHIIAPFFFPVHGSPEDYRRFTDTYCARALTDLGCREVQVDPLVFGPFSSTACHLE